VLFLRHECNLTKDTLTTSTEGWNARAITLIHKKNTHQTTEIIIKTILIKKCAHKCYERGRLYRWIEKNKNKNDNLTVYDNDKNNIMENLMTFSVIEKA